MSKKWKIAFFVSLAINMLLVFGTAYIILVNTLASGQNHDNLITIAVDLDNIPEQSNKEHVALMNLTKNLKKLTLDIGQSEKIN